MTEIGEKGVNLSGGQQQRVSLARAAYASSDVILLDDCLSAVDSVVGEHIFRELVLGFLSDRTRVLVTHNLSLTAPSADLIICLDSVVMKNSNNSHSYLDDDDNDANNGGSSSSSSSSTNGNNEKRNTSCDDDNNNDNDINNYSSRTARSKIIACCKPSDMSQVLQQIHTFDSSDTNSFLTNLLNACTIQTTTATTNSSIQSKGNNNQIPSVHLAISDAVNQEEINATTAAANIGYKNCSYDSLTKAVTSNSNSSSSSNSGSSMLDSSHKKITEKETKSEGDIGVDLYWYYMKACGGITAASGLILGSIAVVIAGLYQNVASGEWMNAIENNNGDINSSKQFFYNYLFSIFILLLSNCFSVSTEIISNLNSSKTLHELLTTSVMLSLCSWFDSTPIGRIINRFSQDISTIDTNLIEALYGFIRCLLETSLIIGVITYSLPYLLIAFIPIMLFTIWVSYQYLHISRELKRLESLMKSPVFILFSETLQGLAVVRSFHAEQRFFQLCCERCDNMNRCHLYMWLCNRWLNFRMQVL